MESQSQLLTSSTAGRDCESGNSQCLCIYGDCLKNGQAIEKGEMAVDELGVKATDDTTLEVTLEHPTSYFLSLIGSSGEFAPIRQDIVEKYGTDFAATADKNVYCGPFILTSSENNVWIFEKNENFWDKDSIKLDRCELNYVENADTQLSMYEAGDLDYVQISTAYVPEYKDQAQEYANGNIDFCYIKSGKAIIQCLPIRISVWH